MNVYTALLFKDRVDLHMTLRYMKNATEMQVEFAERSLSNVHVQVDPFWIKLKKPVYLGKNNSVRTLTVQRPEQIPDWLYDLCGSSWIPHVTTEEETLDLYACKVALMTKQSIIRSWDLGVYDE